MNPPFYLHGSTGLRLVGAHHCHTEALYARTVHRDDVGKEATTTEGMAVVLLAAYVPDVGTLVREVL
jgi:hypothetical protein